MERLIAPIRAEIQSLSGERGWRHDWRNEGQSPDYSGVRRKLANLLEHGHAEAVVDLGDELLKYARSQVEESHDDGQTAGEIQACMEIVFRALSASSLPAPRKLLHAIDSMLADEYDLCSGARLFLDQQWPEEDWSTVADTLVKRLAASATPGESQGFSGRYRRDKLAEWCLTALDEAGRGKEATALCESEVAVTGSYYRLVKRLEATGELAGALRWAEDGLVAALKRDVGYVRQLREFVCGAAAKRGDRATVAAHVATDFFDQPNAKTFAALENAAKRANVGAEVRAAALRFLETGDLPFAVPRPPPPPPPIRRQALRARTGASTAATVHAPVAAPLPVVKWPLPIPPDQVPLLAEALLRPGRGSPGPQLTVLLDIAIQQKRADDVLAIHKRLAESRSYYSRPLEDRIARSIAAKYPAQALTIHERLAEGALQHANPGAYETAAEQLREIRALLEKLGRGSEWPGRLARLREEYRRRRLFMDVLDRLEGTPIVAASKRR